MALEGFSSEEWLAKAYGKRVHVTLMVVTSMERATLPTSVEGKLVGHDEWALMLDVETNKGSHEWLIPRNAVAYMTAR